MSEWILISIPPLGFNSGQKIWVYSPNDCFVQIGSTSTDKLFTGFLTNISHYSPKYEEVKLSPTPLPRTVNFKPGLPDWNENAEYMRLNKLNGEPEPVKKRVYKEKKKERFSWYITGTMD